MFRRMIEKTKKFISEGNTEEIKKMRQEVAIESYFYIAGYWSQS